MPNQQHERERDQTHSYWYIPSAPRVNYVLLVMESAGMMKMATDEGSLPPAGCRNRVPIGFWWLQRLAAAELPIYTVPRCFQSIWIYIGERSRSGEPRGAHEGGGRAQGGWRASLPRGHLEASLTSTPSLLDCFRSKKDHREGFIPFGIPFLQNAKIGKKKQKLALGLQLIG